MPIQKRNSSTKAILEILHEHGPLTLELIHRLLPFQISKENLRRTMSFNRKKKLVDILAYDSQTFFYQLNQDPQSREKVGQLLKKEGLISSQPRISAQNWHHQQWCEFWISVMKRQHPDAEIVRESEIPQSQFAKNILLIDNSDLELLPDFLFLLKINEDKVLKIAFEIERTRKSEKRLIQKFKKYADETKVDGVIYICDSGRVADTVRLLFKDKFMAKSDRIGHYGKLFLLLSNQIDVGFDFDQSFSNSEGDTVSFKKWIDYLSTINLLDRKNENLNYF